MVTIVFETHATSVDNESRIASGQLDPPLSELGKQQARHLGERHREIDFGAIFCSDLQRSYRTAEIAFGEKFPIIRDRRLREGDYGNFAGRPRREIESVKLNFVYQPFPNGESWEQASARIRSFLKDLLANYSGKRVMIIGHRATQYGLEHWIEKTPLKDVVATRWRWQPGWEYRLDTL
ncbi:histidine phosphatase family protein [Acidobacteria bacterium AH-259-A15]|nr:histidine phosphatase family protein [Acidobacteria bacterium AH-259-A15]